MATPPRLKTRWFKIEQAQNTSQTGSAVAFMAWRIASHIVKRLRDAGFDIEADATYFGVMRELLVFLLCGADRIAYARLAADERASFTRVMVLRVSEILEENESNLLGPIDGPSYATLFVKQFNIISEHYAEFDWTEETGPDFPFVRYLGQRLEALMAEKDRRWVLEQITVAEIPEAVNMLKRAVNGVFSTEAKPPQRAAAAGD